MNNKTLHILIAIMIIFFCIFLYLQIRQDQEIKELRREIGLGDCIEGTEYFVLGHGYNNVRIKCERENNN